MTANRAASPRVLPRPLLALLLLLALLPAACDQGPPPRTDFPPLAYGYLTKLRLNVATIAIDNATAPRNTAETEHVEALAPVPPAEALTRMAQDRLITAGNGGHAVFLIDDASLTRAPGGFAGTMHVRLDISMSDGAKSGFAEAGVSRTYASPDTSLAATRAALYELVKQMMRDMNVELEYQMKRSLRAYLQPDEQVAPTAPVETQDLNPGAPAPGAGQLLPEPAPPSPSLPATPPSMDAPLGTEAPPGTAARPGTGALPDVAPGKPVPLAPPAPPGE